MVGRASRALSSVVLVYPNRARVLRADRRAHNLDGMLKIKFQGIEIIADTVAEAAALTRELAGQRQGGGVSVQPSPPPEARLIAASGRLGSSATPASAMPTMSAPPSRPQYADVTALRATYRFLGALAAGPVGGTSLREVMRALGVEHPKGVGSKMAAVNKTLEGAVTKASDAYVTQRTADGRIWRPGRKFAEAFAQVERQVRHMPQASNPSAVSAGRRLP